ncbi:MAG: hypothetical protein ABJA02_15120 [Acidobacteriota bacterium]
MNDLYNFENLDTSFVKLEALVGYLCRRGFVGTINVRFDEYSALITVNSAGKLRVSEFDEIGTRVRNGPAAFRSVISKAQSPGGIIDVTGSEVDDIDLFGDENGDARDTNAEHETASKLICHVRIEPPKNDVETRSRRSLSELADFPFDLTNRFEDEAASPTDREVRLEMMVDVTSDLLSTIDEALGQAGLDFTLAFQKACSDVSSKYPFMEPEKRIFSYRGGFVHIDPDTHLRTLATALGDALTRIFDRLAANAKFANVYRIAFQKVELLAVTRKDEFRTTGMARQVDRFLKHSAI